MKGIGRLFLFGKPLDEQDVPALNDIIKFDGTQWISDAGGGGGEANTSSNVGTGEGLAKAKVGVDLPFKSLLGTAGEIILTPSANEVTFSLNSLIAKLEAALIADRALVSDSVSSKIKSSAITGTELGFLSGVTSLIQTQLNARELTANKDAASGYAGLDASSKLKLAQFPAGNALEVLRRNAANTALEFAASSGGNPKITAILVKAADETITSDTIFNTDDTLFFTAVANKIYFIILNIYCVSPTTGDFKYTLSIPSGSARRSSGNLGSNFISTADITASSGVVPTSGAEQILTLMIKVLIGATGGTVGFQWAQNTSDAGNTTVKAGSSMLVYEA